MSTSHATAPDPRPVLYAVACGSPVAGYLGKLVTLANAAGWQVCVVATPDGRKFLDVPALAAQTGHPVRSEFRNPGDTELLPAADAIVVAPATVNTVNKWACGIADTLALGLLIEAYGLGVPTVAMPYTNTAMARHPAFLESMARLRSWGVQVLYGDDVMAMPPPRAGTRHAPAFPWQLALSALGPPRPGPAGPHRTSAPGRVPGSARAGRDGTDAAGAMSASSRGVPATNVTGRVRPAPPTSPRPAPALPRPLPSRP